VLGRLGRPSLRRRAVKTAVAGVGAYLAVAFGAPAAAEAGTYKIWNCNPPGHMGQPVGPWKWTTTGNVSAFVGCAGGGGFGFQVSPASQWTNFQTTSTLYVSRPASIQGIGILRLKAWFTAWLDGSGSPAFVQSGVVPIAGPPGGDFTISPWVSPVGATDNAYVDLSLYCSTGGGTDCFFAHSRLLEVLGTELELYEAVAPTVEIEGGTLLGSAEQRDTRTVEFRATDAHSGIAHVEVRLDGKVVGTRDFTGDPQHCQFADFHACSPTESGDITVDTRALPDGKYALELRSFDAAGNADIVQAPSQVAIKNAIDEPAGDTLQPVRPAPVPPVAKDEAKDSTSTAAAPVRLTARAGAQRTVRVAYGKRVAVRGKLTDEAGRPLGNTDLHVLVQNRMATASLANKGTVRTRPDGTFVYITPIGPSRMIRFAYRASEGARDYSATTDVTLLVRASAALRATPRRVRNGRSVRFTGRLRGLPYPTTGKLVDLQAKVGSKWRTFQVVRAGRNGRFTYRYRFTRTFQPLTYRFRARIRMETSYPYQTGSSNQVRVKVRP